MSTQLQARYLNLCQPRGYASKPGSTLSPTPMAGKLERAKDPSACDAEGLTVRCAEPLPTSGTSRSLTIRSWRAVESEGDDVVALQMPVRDWHSPKRPRWATIPRPWPSTQQGTVASPPFSTTTMLRPTFVRTVLVLFLALGGFQDKGGRSLPSQAVRYPCVIPAPLRPTSLVWAGRDRTGRLELGPLFGKRSDQHHIEPSADPSIH